MRSIAVLALLVSSPAFADEPAGEVEDEFAHDPSVLLSIGETKHSGIVWGFAHTFAAGVRFAEGHWATASISIPWWITYRFPETSGAEEFSEASVGYLRRYCPKGGRVCVAGAANVGRQHFKFMFQDDDGIDSISYGRTSVFLEGRFDLEFNIVPDWVTLALSIGLQGHKKLEGDEDVDESEATTTMGLALHITP